MNIKQIGNCPAEEGWIAINDNRKKVVTVLE
jgi:hypothetical protein